ncbi:hypothetical protein CYMTET_6544 [Cymbomonas tetramitiformis]|uniref:Ankyrin repeat protein n=1 Tax=Cymbomonas tetramitiformis TaxID=36881 RepID=A0AAE0GX06_9CHLO|nr:hypothetical protein CYMTET_6544 [Cymbomonas tetramitiformis]
MRARPRVDDDGDGGAARSLLNLAMITPGNSPTLWTALVDYGADSDEEALLSEMCARGNAAAVRYLLTRTEEPTIAGDSRRVLRVSPDQMRKAISDRMLRAGADTRSIGEEEGGDVRGAETMMMHTPLQEATARGRWEMAAALVAFMNEDDVVRDWEGLLAERSSIVSPSTASSRVSEYYARVAPYR